VALQHAQSTAALEKVLSLRWRRYLVNDQNILQADLLQAAMTEAAGLSAEQAAAVLSASTQPATKQQLKRNTDDALKHGAFGVLTKVFPVPAAAGGG